MWQLNEWCDSGKWGVNTQRECINGLKLVKKHIGLMRLKKY